MLQKPENLWETFRGGKHAGSSAPQVAFKDPDWLYYMVGHQDSYYWQSPAMQAQALQVADRGRRILIPNNEDGDLVVEYLFSSVDRKLSHVEVIPADRTRYEGGALSIRKPVFDLSLLHRKTPYDKTGQMHLLRVVRSHILGFSNGRMTKRRTENFFADPNNFYGEQDEADAPPPAPSNVTELPSPVR